MSLSEIPVWTFGEYVYRYIPIIYISAFASCANQESKGSKTFNIQAPENILDVQDQSRSHTSPPCRVSSPNQGEDQQQKVQHLQGEKQQPAGSPFGGLLPDPDAPGYVDKHAGS
jgi:hypothetical protein